MTSWNGNIFRVTGHLCGEFAGTRWIPLTKASDVELWCFLWSAPWINGWLNNCMAGDLRRHRAHYDVSVIMIGLCHNFVHTATASPPPHGQTGDLNWYSKTRQALKISSRHQLWTHEEFVKWVFDTDPSIYNRLRLNRWHTKKKHRAGNWGPF